MSEQWEVVVEPYVIDDLMAFGIHPFDAVTLIERVRALADELTATEGHSRDAFLVLTVHPAILGTIFERRLLALYRHVRIPYRTWRNLWLRPRERCVISIRYLQLLGG